MSSIEEITWDDVRKCRPPLYRRPVFWICLAFVLAVLIILSLSQKPLHESDQIVSTAPVVKAVEKKHIQIPENLCSMLGRMSATSRLQIADQTRLHCTK